MSDPQGLKATHTDATGTLITGAFYLKGYQCISGGTAGEIVFRDGGVSGTDVVRFNIGTGTQPIGLSLPGAGLLFETSLHVTLPTSAKVTVFYGK